MYQLILISLSCHTKSLDKPISKPPVNHYTQGDGKYLARGSHTLPIVYPYCTHTVAILLPYLKVWLHYGYTMDALWKHYGIPMASPNEVRLFLSSFSITTTLVQSVRTLPRRRGRGGGSSWDSRKLRPLCVVGGWAAAVRNGGARRGRCKGTDSQDNPFGKL